MKKRRRLKNEVNAGSMADIAFLLLIFFLVTTTIEIDKGISVRLPPLVDTPPAKPPAKNVLSIKLNADNELLVEGERTELIDLKGRAIEFISNPEKLNTLPIRPKNAIISLQHDRSTQYKHYVEVYNELKAAYNHLWEEQSQKSYNKSFKGLDKEQIRQVRKIIPFVISEAEPVDYGAL